MRRIAQGAALVVGLATATSARADADGLFGHGPRSAALAGSDLADASPAAAAYAGPTRATEPGVRVAVGYAHAWSRLTLNGAPAGVADISGTDVDVQMSRAPREGRIAFGFALAAHVPDRGLSQLRFAPATEPAFVQYDVAPQRLTTSAVLAARFRSVAVAGGVLGTPSVGESGSDVTVNRDARGSTATTSSADVDLGYRFAPIVAASFDVPAFSVAARLRGSSGGSVAQTSVIEVGLRGDPLGGATTARITGLAGYDPLTVALGGRVRICACFALLASVTYARWRDAPGSYASLDAGTGGPVSPVRQQSLGDTVSPRAGLEWTPPGRPFAVRAGYAFVPSPVVGAHGYTTPVDADRHAITLGAGLQFEDVAGVDLALDANAGLHLLVDHGEQKESQALPWSHYEVGGHLVQAGAALTARFR